MCEDDFERDYEEMMRMREEGFFDEDPDGDGELDIWIDD